MARRKMRKKELNTDVMGNYARLAGSFATCGCLPAASMDSSYNEEETGFRPGQNRALMEADFETKIERGNQLPYVCFGDGSVTRSRIKGDDLKKYPR